MDIETKDLEQQLRVAVKHLKDEIGKINVVKLRRHYRELGDEEKYREVLKRGIEDILDLAQAVGEVRNDMINYSVRTEEDFYTIIKHECDVCGDEFYGKPNELGSQLVCDECYVDGIDIDDDEY